MLEGAGADALISEEKYRRIASSWPSGAAAVTSRAALGEYAGSSVSAMTPLSLSPPMFLVCLDRQSNTGAAIMASGIFCINILRDDAEEVCRALARKGGDKFEGLSFQLGVLGAPILDQAAAYVECRVEAVHEAGDHYIFSGFAVAGEDFEAAPLLYHRGKFRCG